MHSRTRSSPRRTGKYRRLLSYADPGTDDEAERRDEDPARTDARLRIAEAAVACFLKTCPGRWQSLQPMPHNNPGFDVRAVAHDGEEERIEVKGQGGAWTEEGVALTPTEVATAERYRGRYWLCVVEFALDESRRRLHLIRDPYGLTDQFRFDCGWRSAAEEITSAPLQPERGLFVSIPGVGRGKINSVKRQGRFSKIHVFLDCGKQVWKTFDPGKMTLSRD